MIDTDALVARLRRYGDMPFSGAVDWLCVEHGVDSRGDQVVVDDKNIALDACLSEAGVDAARAILADARLELRQLMNHLEIVAVYGFSAQRLLDLPLVKRRLTLRTPPYRQLHWMPTLVELAQWQEDDEVEVEVEVDGCG